MKPLDCKVTEPWARVSSVRCARPNRLALARALLQDVDVVLLDESFVALDPDNQGRALECALRRARTLVVSAHP